MNFAAFTLLENAVSSPMCERFVLVGYDFGDNFGQVKLTQRAVTDSEACAKKTKVAGFDYDFEDKFKF